MTGTTTTVWWWLWRSLCQGSWRAKRNENSACRAVQLHM